MEDIVIQKGLVASFVAVIGFLCNCFSTFVVVLVICMIIDYATGIVAAALEGKCSSKKGFKGAIKKVGYLILLLIVFLLDFTLKNMASMFSIEYDFAFFGVLTTIWLISTESISIIENLYKIGVPIPPFISKAFKNLKKEAEILGKKGCDKK